MTTDIQLKSGRRQLMVRDGVAFLILTATTGVLFTVTLLLFRSFATHRADLARQAGEDGRLALSQDRPRDAIAYLRTALSYSPNERDYELLLAQALGADGRTEEADNYFLNLWEARPGDGFINLQLARLARQRKQPADAVNYYRASIFGSWYGEGDVHRRDVRLELADYLIQQKELSEAQSELLIAASNSRSLPDPGLDLTLGDAFLRANDPANAAKLYRKAMVDSPDNATPYERAGRLAYQEGDYVHSSEWLEQALRKSAGASGSAADPEDDYTTLLKNSERMLQLSPNLASNDSGRIARLLNARAIAKKRFDACAKQQSATASLPASMEAMTARWTASAKLATRTAMLHDPGNEDSLKTLIGDSELLTAQFCGTPQGDDAVLLLWTQHDKNRP